MSAERRPALAGPRWTGRAYLLLGVGCALVTASVASRSPTPLYVALPLLLAPFAAASVGGRRLGRADLVWNAEGIGEDVSIVGSVKGTPAGEARNLMVVPARPVGASPSAPLRVARRGDRLDFSVGWRLAEPTIATVPSPTVLWRDPLGLVERSVDGERPELRLNRYPAELHRLDAIRLDRTVALPGETRSRRVGPSGEFYGVREASPGEPRRRINWRATARLGRLVVNDYQVDLTGDLLILLDVRPVSTDRAMDERLLGIARAGVYGIADGLFRSKVRIGYATFGEFVEALPLSTGRAHRLRVLHAIEASRLNPVAGPAERCAVALRRYYRPGLTTLVVSNWTGDSSQELLPYLRRQGYPPLLIAPSPLPILEGTGSLRPEEEALARRLEYVERQVRLADIWRFAPVVDWSDYWSLEGLARFLQRPMHRRVY